MEFKTPTIKDSALAFAISFAVSQVAILVFTLLGTTFCNLAHIDISTFELFLNNAYGYFILVIILNSALIGCFLYFNKKKDNNIVSKPKTSKILLYILVASATFFMLSPIINCVDSLLEHLKIPLNTIPYDLKSLNGIELTFSILSFVIIPPIVEEFLFRGFIFKGLKSGGKAFSIILSALMFSIFHMSIDQTVYPILVGLLLAVIMYYENNILYCITVHLTNNALSFIFAYFNLSLSYKHWSFILLAIVLFVIFLSVVLFFTFWKSKNTKGATEKTDYKYLFITLTIMVIIWLLVVTTKK